MTSSDRGKANPTKEPQMPQSTKLTMPGILDWYAFVTSLVQPRTPAPSARFVATFLKRLS